ncbi:cytochrome P450 [Immersiella caudata]|uniref:Cytochrome P450 n=1 Tax=Immersiella caudata TaxID=314043 RepID=A0AA39WAS7_9PEZI|nr:cytochrome P450 [Immersiella caudata]
MASAFIIVILGVAVVGVAYLYRMLLPTPLLNGIPYDRDYLHRPFGDAFAVKSQGQRTHEPSASVFSLCRKLGSPIVQLLLTSLPGTHPAIILDDPREIEDILLRRNREFDRSPMTTELFDKVLPKSTLAQLTTPQLKAQKRLWSDVMHPDFLRRAVAPNLQTAAEELVQLWTVKAELSEEPFEVSADFQSTALDAIWVAVLGDRIGVLRHEIAKARGEKASEETAKLVEIVRFAVEEGSGIINQGIGSVWPALTYFFLSLTPSFRKFRRVGHDEVQKIMKRACERFYRLSETSTSTGDEDEHDRCAMDFVLRREIMKAKKEGRPVDPTNDPTMIDELWLMLLAGFPTSAEISEADIPLLDATIEETVRFSATASITSRRALVDTQVLGYHIPKGATVIMNLRVNKQPLDVDESLRSETSRAAQAKRTRGGFEGPSGRDLEQFEPRRWLAQDATGKEVYDAYALPSLNFGGGFRGCFGKRLAYLEMRIVVATLMLNFEFLPLPEKMAGLEAWEEVFRKPVTAYVKLRVLEG